MIGRASSAFPLWVVSQSGLNDPACQRFGALQRDLSSYESRLRKRDFICQFVYKLTAILLHRNHPVDNQLHALESEYAGSR